MTYEYICEFCNYEWELSQKITDEPIKNCPKCNNSTAKRLISFGIGFILKGGGWFKEGYSKK